MSARNKSGRFIKKKEVEILVLWLKKHGPLGDMCDVVYGFTDALEQIKQGKVKKQEELARTYLTGPEWRNIIDGSHNAQSDVEILIGLLKHFDVGPSALCSACLSARQFFERQAAARQKKDLLPKLAALRPAVSVAMLGKMASQGVTIEELKTEFRLHGEKGIEVCLGVHVNGKPRVTRSKKILEKIVNCIESL